MSDLANLRLNCPRCPNALIYIGRGALGEAYHCNVHGVFELNETRGLIECGSKVPYANDDDV